MSPPPPLHRTGTWTNQQFQAGRAVLQPGPDDRPRGPVCAPRDGSYSFQKSGVRITVDIYVVQKKSDS